MSEEEVPAGPPAWPGGARTNDPWGGRGWTSPPPVPGWWPQQYYTYEPPPPPRRTSRLVVLGVFLVILVFATSAAATAVIATRGIGGSGNTSSVQAAIVDIDTSLGGGAAAAGTGIVLASSGVVLTNYHVVNGADGAVSVRLTATGVTYSANVIGQDPAHDIAVLQLQGASGLSTAPIGDSSSVHIGDSVTALGNAQGRGGAPAVATGTVTALGQQITAADESGQNPETLTGMIQTNAPIQPGDSGGPLVNSDGRVIGMDTAASGGRRGSQPSSVQAFAIPIDTALNYAHQILTSPTTIPTGALLGVCVIDSTSPRGAVVTPSSAVGCATGVVGGEPASTTALAAGDVITSLGGTAVVSQSSLKVILQDDHPGQSVVVVWLDPAGQMHQATVVLAAASPQQ